MKTFKGKPITGATPQNRPAGNMLTNQNNTSAQAQQLIKRPGMPFQSKQAPANLPAPCDYDGNLGVGDGKSPNTAGMRTGAKPTMAATGNKTPGGYGKVVGGQKGLTHPRKSTDTAANLGVKSKRNASFFGAR